MIKHTERRSISVANVKELEVSSTKHTVDKNCEGVSIVKKKKFKKGDRVYMEGRGYGTVAVDTYNNIHFTTYTPVKWDDYLGQKFPLAEDTEDLTLVTE